MTEDELYKQAMLETAETSGYKIKRVPVPRVFRKVEKPYLPRLNRKVVGISKRNYSYTVQITVDGIVTYLGSSKCKIEAAKMYDAVAMKHGKTTNQSLGVY
jgi:hypothetical protein